MSLAKKFIKLFLPKSAGPRKLSGGIAAGTTAQIDFDYDTAFYFGRHEVELHDHYRRLVKPGMKVFDVGMYRGWDALTFAVMTGEEVVTFDGNPDSLANTKVLIEPSGYAGKISLLNGYVGPKEVDGQVTLDATAETHFMPDFIKMDIEGAEANALRGANKILSQKKPAMVIETHGEEVEKDCIEQLEKFGYKITAVDAKGKMFGANRVMDHNRWIICEP